MTAYQTETPGPYDQAPGSYAEPAAPALLSRDDILLAQDLPYEDVACPEWGGTVRVGTLSGAERDAYEARIAGDGKVNMVNLRASFAAAVIIDVHGSRVFKRSDIDKLGMKSAKPLDRIFDVGRRLSGLSEHDVEEMAEDFGDAPAGLSSSG